MVYCNNGRDSVEVPINKTTGIDTVRVMIDNLQERIYTFEIVTYDNDGNKSVPSIGNGESYGDNYKNSRLPRLVMSALYFEDTDTLEVIWGQVDPNAIIAAARKRDVTGKSV